ncbi:MAG: DedA family protein [Thermoleophilia bacterium]|nr:DedA family protein [Thermoleophilia bacterium]
MEHVTDWISSYGLWALFALTLLENLNLPLPSEPVLLFGGYLASTGDLNVVAVVVVALAGSLCGAVGSYLIGQRGRWLLDRHGRWVGATPKRVAASDLWMQRHGDKAVLYGRVVPLVRTFVSVAAGLARMPMGRFVALTSIGAGAWIALLTSAGYLLGDNWERAGIWLEPLKYAAVAAIVGGTVVLVVRWMRGRGARTAE